jgi:3-oxoacyl-[acyl-carrier-protein] synthase-3
MPPTSTLVQESLGIERCVEVEISANCTAPYKGLLFAASQLRLGTVRRALVCAVQYASFLFQPPWANPQSMGEDQGLVRWIVSDGAGALALECGEPDTELRVWLESSGCGERSGMFLPLGSAHPDLLGNFRDGGQHVTQDGRYVLRVGVPRALRALSRMLDCLDVAPGKIDHFLPAVSSAQLEQGLRRLMAQHCGVPSDCWRVNFRRVGYLGGVGLTVLLDEMARAQQLRPGDLVCAFAEESSKWMAAGLALRWNP